MMRSTINPILAHTPLVARAPNYAMTPPGSSPGLVLGKYGNMHISRRPADIARCVGVIGSTPIHDSVKSYIVPDALRCSRYGDSLVIVQAPDSCDAHSALAALLQKRGYTVIEMQDTFEAWPWMPLLNYSISLVPTSAVDATLVTVISAAFARTGVRNAEYAYGAEQLLLAGMDALLIRDGTLSLKALGTLLSGTVAIVLKRISRIYTNSSANAEQLEILHRHISSFMSATAPMQHDILFLAQTATALLKEYKNCTGSFAINTIFHTPTVIFITPSHRPTNTEIAAPFMAGAFLLYAYTGSCTLRERLLFVPDRKVRFYIQDLAAIIPVPGFPEQIQRSLKSGIHTLFGFTSLGAVFAAHSETEASKLLSLCPMLLVLHATDNDTFGTASFVARRYNKTRQTPDTVPRVSARDVAELPDDWVLIIDIAQPPLLLHSLSVHDWPSVMDAGEGKQPD